jgi:hypothetical protein
MLILSRWIIFPPFLSAASSGEEEEEDPYRLTVPGHADFFHIT